MKVLTKTFSLAVLLVLFTLPVHAQALLGESNSVVTFESTPVEQVQISQLQEIIHLDFSSQQDLTETAPQLLDVALRHPDADARKMAVIGLYSVGSEAELFKLIRAVDMEPSTKVRATMVRVLNTYFDGRYADDDPRFMHAALLNGQ